jgi:hypothetical protein
MKIPDQKGDQENDEIDGILEALGNITAEAANRRARHRKLSLPSMLRGN